MATGKALAFCFRAGETVSERSDFGCSTMSCDGWCCSDAIAESRMTMVFSVLCSLHLLITYQHMVMSGGSQLLREFVCLERAAERLWLCSSVASWRRVARFVSMFPI